MAQITSEKNVTLADVCAEANLIWKKCLAVFKSRGMEESTCDQLLSDMRKQHPEFAKAYPIVIRYQCQTGRYHPQAFKKYMKYIVAHPWKNQSEYLDSQATYCMILYKETTPKWDKNKAQFIYTQTRELLQKEHDTFKDYSEKYQKVVEEDETRHASERENALANFYKEFGVQAVDVPLRVACDISEQENISVPQADITFAISSNEFI